MSKIYVPKTCRVGFQKRADTFSGKLAYVIYYDSSGTLRKEKSWNTWTDSKIAPHDFENTPTSGFVLNKGHTRYSWSHFGERRTVIRIYDPRGVEFEVTPENLVGLLMHTDCSRREIQGDLVYAWCGTELMLLPCSSEEYKAALNYTKLQETRVSANDLKEGFTYVTKNEENLVYLGRHMWYEVLRQYTKDEKRTGTKQHIFCDLDGKNCKPVKSVSSTISKQVSDGCHDKYSDWVDAYLKSPESSKIVGWERRAISDAEWDKDWGPGDFGGPTIQAATDESGDIVTVVISGYHDKFKWDDKLCRNVPIPSAKDDLYYRRRHIVLDDGHTVCAYDALYHNHLIRDRSKFFHLYAIFENGTKKEWSER